MSVDVEQVLALADRAAAADGVSPLNDDARLALTHADSARSHLVTHDDGAVIAYAQVDPSGQQPVAVLVVDPGHRRQGHGRRLLARVRDDAGPATAFWAFHDLPAARALAGSAGLEPVRTLLLMRAELTDEVPVPTAAAGIEIRPFVPGADEEAWLAVNSRAFADHPEQGRMTRADLQDRTAEDWFDPADFLLAVDATAPGGPVVGFHWTKRHSTTRGEVYVLGVDPDHGGRGLGTTLLLSGLRHLQTVGVTEVILYVEADHERAVRLYTGRGFQVATRDVMYARPSGPPVPSVEPEEN